MKIFLILLWPLLTQALEFKAFVDKTEVGLNETFVLNFQFESKSSLPKRIYAPDLFHLKDFHLLDESSSQQSSIQIINGKMSKTSMLLKSYRLQSKAVGIFKIPALNVRANGKTFQTEPIAIKVVKDKLTAPSPTPKPAPGFPFNMPDPFNFPNSVFKGLPDLFSNQEKGSAKLKLELSRNSVYKSERLRANWFVLSSSSSIHFDLFRVPNLKGFWREKLKIHKPFIGSEIVGKTLYKKQLIDSLWLFPLKSGELEMDSYSIRLSSFFRRGQVVSVPARKIKVKDLPSEGLDKTFTGAVGDFSAQYLMKKNVGAVNEPLSLKIIFKGSGHPRFIDLPQISFPPSVEIYPPVQKSQFSDKGVGTKEFEILIVPKKEGQLRIPSFSLSSFNPKTGRYVSHKSQEFLISVKQGESN
ncbi:MAG: BatD family protein, partial [Oligoflexia bacterium]|nr:BatD family protein [Oligoflexia bacterium]